jgi:dimethylamine monooxygenase subunit A
VARRGSIVGVVPTVEPIPYRPWLDRGHVVDGAFRWRLGARPLDLHDWIELGPDADGPDGWIAQKEQVMADHAPTAFAALDGVEPECEEVAEALVEHLRTTWPDRYDQVTIDPLLHPLDAVARLVPEDLVVMVERDGALVFGSGSVCFPNRWDLRSKIGASMAAVHAPVAQLNEQLEGAVDGFFERLRPERSFWRLGWGILDTADGYTPLDGTAAPRPQRPTMDDLHVRVERETLRRFPRTNAVLFTIRTYVSPLRAVIADPENRSAIAGIVDAMPADVRGYKDITDAMRAAVG